MRSAGVAVATLALLAVPTAANADGWRPVGGAMVDTSRPDIGPRGARASIGWTTPDGRILSRGVGADGRLGRVVTLSQGWTYLTSDPVVVGRAVVAAGVRSVQGAGLYWPGGPFRVGGGTPAPTAIGTDDFAYASWGQDALSLRGRLVYAYTDGGSGVVVQPQSAGAARVVRGTASWPALAAEGAVVRLAWYSGGEGIVVGEVSGLPDAPVIGALQVAPGSSSALPGQRTALVATGGRTWTAYPGVAGGIRLWRVGDPGWLDVATDSPVTAVTIAPAARGRLWLAYASADEVCVRRSDPLVRRFGDPNCLPAVASGLALTGTDAADVVATTAPRIVYARFLPALSVSVRKGRVRVTDAGRPVARAEVVVGSRVIRTDARGVAVVGAGRTVVRAAGYAPWRSPAPR